MQREDSVIPVDDLFATYIRILVHQLTPFAATLLAKSLDQVDTRFPLDAKVRNILSMHVVYETILRYGVESGSLGI